MKHENIWLTMIVGLVFSFTFLSAAAPQSRQDSGAKTESIEKSKLELIEKRLDAMEKTMQNFTDEIIKWRTQEKCQTIGCNCRFVRECVYITCCRWGPPGNGGTAVCLEQCCGAWETKFKCD